MTLSGNKETDMLLSTTFQNIKDYRPQAKAVACFSVKPQRTESWLYSRLQNISGLHQWMSSVPAHRQDSQLYSFCWVEREHAVKCLAVFRSYSQTENYAAEIGTLNQAYKNNEQVHFRRDEFNVEHD